MWASIYIFIQSRIIKYLIKNVHKYIELAPIVELLFDHRVLLKKNVWQKPEPGPARWKKKIPHPAQYNKKPEPGPKCA